MCGTHVQRMYMSIQCMYTSIQCMYVSTHVQRMYMSIHCMYMYIHSSQLQPVVSTGFRVSRIRYDGKWSVVVNLYRRVCIVSIHILTFMNVCVPCTYKCITTWTCMYNLHTFRYIHVQGTDMYVHVCALMNMCEHVHTCLYHVQTRMYRFALSCPGGQDSRCRAAMFSDIWFFFKFWPDSDIGTCRMWPDHRWYPFPSPSQRCRLPASIEFIQ